MTSPIVLSQRIYIKYSISSYKMCKYLAVMQLAIQIFNSFTVKYSIIQQCIKHIKKTNFKTCISNHKIFRTLLELRHHNDHYTFLIKILSQDRNFNGNVPFFKFNRFLIKRITFQHFQIFSLKPEPHQSPLVAEYYLHAYIFSHCF